MTLDKEPPSHDSKNFWNKPDRVLRQALRPFVENPRTLIDMTTAELQAELRRQLDDSVGA